MKPTSVDSRTQNAKMRIFMTISECFTVNLFNTTMVEKLHRKFDLVSNGFNQFFYPNRAMSEINLNVIKIRFFKSVHCIQFCLKTKQ